MLDEPGSIAETTEELPEAQAPAAEANPIEAIALEKGWSRKEDWRGPEEAWRPAEDFIRIGLDRGREASREMRQIKESTARTERALATLHERTVAQIKQEAEERFVEASKAGDFKAAAEATRQFESAGREIAPSGPPPEVEDFRQRNKWFGADQAATLFAQDIADRAAKAGKDAASQIAEAEAETRKRFPELFGTPAKPPASVSAPNSRTAAPSRRDRGFNDLPANAQGAGRRMAGKMGFTLEDYAKLWYSENQA